MSEDWQVGDLADDPRAYVSGGSRCALKASDWLNDWFVGTSPRNGDNACVEGDWGDWVELAKNILAADEQHRAIAPDQSA